MQADGKILVGGTFQRCIGGQTRNGIARLDAIDRLCLIRSTRTLNEFCLFNRGAGGRQDLGGRYFLANIGGQTRNSFARLTNDTAALQNVAVTQTTVTWTRGGASPLLARVTFEYFDRQC